MEILKTGVIYDPRMLDHKARRKHPETPQRIKVIIDILHEKQILTHFKIDYIPSVHRLALQNQLCMAHPQKYINFCKNLWPKSGHRADITVLDTYFNEKSQNAARIAAGCLLEGIDKIMEGVWQNGFAVIRPPGHHSGAKNTINGFCIYNSVAICANYILEKWKKNRVAIVDWDVHHGDGTQHIMQRNEDVMLISLHRYDRGTFYPAGDEGHYSNNGQLSAKGTKINIPFDFVDENFQQYNFQSPGDNEYIYMYHRLIEPVLKQFNPDVILVSSGFDAANGDPLGGFTITPNGYHYLTRKLMELKKPVLVALQGGYNLDSIKNSAYNIIRALLHEEPEEEHRDYKGELLKETQIKQICSLHPVMHQQMDAIIEFHSSYWESLKNQELSKYTERIKKNEEKIFGIVEDQSSSDESKSSDDEETRYIEEFHNDTRVELVTGKPMESVQEDSLKRQKSRPKKDSEKENKKKQSKEKKQKKPKKTQPVEQTQPQEEESVTAQFYFAAGHMQRFKNFSLSNEKLHKWSYESQIKFFESNFEEKQFAPKYYGQEDNYIIIENLLYGKKLPLVIMDIKLSRQSKNPFISEEKRQKEAKKEQKSIAGKLAFRISGYTTQNFKEGGIMTYTEDEVKKLLKLVVDNSNKTIFSQFLQKMVACLSQVKRKYYGTSIMLVKGQKQNVETCDSDLIEGIQNLRTFIDNIE